MWEQLRKKYPDAPSKAKSLVNHAIRREIPGGAPLLDLLELANQMRDRGACPQAVVDRLQQIRDLMGADVIERATRESATPSPAQLPTQSPPAVPSPPAAAKPALSADLLRRRDAPVDPRTWTPSAAVVEQMGVLSDEELARIAGVSASVIASARKRLDIPPASAKHDAERWTPAMDKLLGTAEDGELARRWGRSAESVRRRRLKLGIAPVRIKAAWTPERDAIAMQGSVTEAAARLGVSVAAVKTRRSRLAKGAR